MGMVVVAILAIGAFGAITATAHKKKKAVATTVTMAFNLGEPAGQSGNYNDASFSGKVGSTKAKCVNGRTVVVNQVNGPAVGEDKSAADGSWTVAAKSAVAAGEQYTATVLKRKIVRKKNRNHRHIIKCLPASETITIPNP